MPVSNFVIVIIMHGKKYKLFMILTVNSNCVVVSFAFGEGSFGEGSFGEGLCCVFLLDFLLDFLLVFPGVPS